MRTVTAQQLLVTLEVTAEEAAQLQPVLAQLRAGLQPSPHPPRCYRMGADLDGLADALAGRLKQGVVKVTGPITHGFLIGRETWVDAIAVYFEMPDVQLFVKDYTVWKTLCAGVATPQELLEWYVTAKLRVDRPEVLKRLLMI